jgi:hypothetical protein
LVHFSGFGIMFQEKSGNPGSADQAKPCTGKPEENKKVGQKPCCYFKVL